MATQPAPRHGVVSEMPHAQPNPAAIFDTINSFQKTAAIKAAIELDLFTAIADGTHTSAEIAKRINASERGVRILSDYLVTIGLLHKIGDAYSTTVDTGTFLNRKSPAYMGSVIGFLLEPTTYERFDAVAECVRDGGNRNDTTTTLIPENPRWVDFAKSMQPMMAMIGGMVAKQLDLDTDRPIKVLDIAASHGMFGLSVAREYPQAQIVALDWTNVLEVTKENAAKLGFADRLTTIAGDCFGVDFGSDYDAILLPNILHHFDKTTIERLLRKCNQALRHDGAVAIVEFVPNEDRVSPPVAAGFSLTMLVATAHGDAYTFAEYQQMLKNSGFHWIDSRPLAPTPQTLVLGRKA